MFICHDKNWLTWNIFWYSVSFLWSSPWSIKSFNLSQVWGSVCLRIKILRGVMHPYSGAMKLSLPSGLEIYSNFQKCTKRYQLKFIFSVKYSNLDIRSIMILTLPCQVWPSFCIPLALELKKPCILLWRDVLLR